MRKSKCQLRARHDDRYAFTQNFHQQTYTLVARGGMKHRAHSRERAFGDTHRIARTERGQVELNAVVCLDTRADMRNHCCGHMGGLMPEAHDAGDTVLIEVARRLRQFIRTGDAVLRWGGEEFLLVARDVCSDTAANLAARLLDVISGKRVRIGHGKAVSISASIGFAPLPFPAPHGARFSVDHVIGLADAGAYLSKHAGRACAHGVLPLAGAAPLDPINEPIASPEFLSSEDGRRVQLIKILPAAAAK